jgi:hypothetical protein
MPKIFIPTYCTEMVQDEIIRILNKLATEMLQPRTIVKAESETRINNHRGTSGIVIHFGVDDKELIVPTDLELIRALREELD